MTNESKNMTVAAAAEMLKTTSLSVMMHIKRGLIAGEEVDGSWYVAADSLAVYLSQADDAARGSLCKSSCKHGCSTCD